MTGQPVTLRVAGAATWAPPPAMAAVDAGTNAAQGDVETVTLIVDESIATAVPQLLDATRAASPRTFKQRHVDSTALTAGDGCSLARKVVFTVGETSSSAQLVSQRTLVVAANAVTGSRLRRLAESVGHDSVEVAVATWRDGPPAPGTIRLRLAGDARLQPEDAAWLGRHLARTKLGLVLGAGGARGYAHVGAIDVLAHAGYAVDAVSGTSVGAIVGAGIAAELTPEELDRMMRRLFSPSMVDMLLRPSLSGLSPGRKRMVELLRETFGQQRIEQLSLPLTIMAVDLDAGQTVPLRTGPLWEALAAATALPGMFAPWEREGRRLIDALALAPLPSMQITGADVSVAIDLLGGDGLPNGNRQRLNGAAGPAAPPRLIGALGELVELVAFDASLRNAAKADLVVRPQFGPTTWREFSQADRIFKAGRVAAQKSLPALSRLAVPSHRNH